LLCSIKPSCAYITYFRALQVSLHSRKDNVVGNYHTMLTLEASHLMWARKPELRGSITITCIHSFSLLEWFYFPRRFFTVCLPMDSYNLHVAGAKCRVMLWNIKLLEVFVWAFIATSKKLVHWFQCAVSQPLISSSLNKYGRKTRNNEYTARNFKGSLIKLVASRLFLSWTKVGGSTTCLWKQELY
jgi:hypothetical protein